jgi:hypothetical protein
MGCPEYPPRVRPGGILCLMTKPKDTDLRSITAFVSTSRNRVWLNVTRQWYGPGNVKHPGKSRVVVMTMPVPVDDHEMLQLLANMLRYVQDPNRRHIKPPRAVVWREVGTGLPVPPGGGEGGEDTPPDMDELPVDGGFPSAAGDSTITTGPVPVKAASPKATRSSAREPRIRKLGAGKQGLPAGG